MKSKHPKQRHSVILMLLILAFAITAFAHPGRTDGKGGHYDRQNGGYHYHHGYSAHQHPNGKCPYNYKWNNTDNYSDNNNYKNDEYEVDEEEYSKTNFEFLGKLSDDHEWHTSDIVHLLLITLCSVVAYRLFIFDPSTKLRDFYRYGDLASLTVISLIYYGFSLSVIFPYDLKGFEFLGMWLLNGIILPLLVSLPLIPLISLICMFLSAFNLDNKPKKTEMDEK